MPQGGRQKQRKLNGEKPGDQDAVGDAAKDKPSGKAKKPKVRSKGEVAGT